MANATVIQVPTGNDFSALGLGMLLPITTGLDGWWFPGTDAASSITNRKIGGTAATVVGTPTYSSGFATFTGQSNYLQTQATETATGTILAVGRRPPGAPAYDNTDPLRSVLIGNSASGLGSLLFTRSGAAITTTDINYQTTWTVSASPAVRATSTGSTSTNFNNWGFFAGVVDDTAKTRTAYNKTTGLSNTASETGNTRAPVATKFRIGSSAATYAGQTDVAFAAVYSVALTSGQIDTIYAFVKSYLSRRSITI
jgi:hypothetical protein